MSKIIVGMSGGVDSAVTAYLLKEQGHEVIGVTLRTWQADDGSEGRCCEIDDARSVAFKLGIPYYPINCLMDFKEKVTDPFIESYIKGETPNPCIVCNRYVKWEKLLHTAKIMQADYIATGHYASIAKLDNGRYTVKTAAFANKDQTYMLYRLSQEQLAHTLMPLGGMSKDEVRAIAEKAGLSVASKPDSQEICFVIDGDYADYIEKNYDGSLPEEGNFVDEDGNILGRHKGIIHYTVGQRKGLGLPLGYPAYVKSINAEKDEVVIAKEDSLFNDTLYCREVNYMSIEGLEIGEKLRCLAKIRYRHKAESAEVEALADNRIRIRFDSPVRAATPGQSVVMYDENGYVIGGGVIEGE